MTRRHLQKARDIEADARISLVVPVKGRLTWFLPPGTIQLRGRLELLDGVYQAGTKVFTGFWIGRRILAAYDEARRRGESRICFLRIAPDPVVRTYMVSSSLWHVARNMEAGAGRVELPAEHDQPQLTRFGRSVSCSETLRSRRSHAGGGSTLDDALLDGWHRHDGGLVCTQA
jgi:hypothetical protein